MAHLLVVEDDPVSLRILVSLLDKRGHIPHVATNVAEAIASLERNALIDLLILDNQLQGEFGWQFLDYVRKDFVFRGIPALIYTGSSDRNSVLKYLQLGVQKILVKPYNANQIEEEITRAESQDWRGMIFEPAERVCQRLNISEDDYFKSLSRAAVDVRDRVPQLNKLVGQRDLRLFDDHISTLQSLALTLGVSILENAVESIQEALRKQSLDQAIYFINRLVPTARLMHHRSLAHFGLTNSDDFPQDLFDEERPEAPVVVGKPGPGPQAGAGPDPIDHMLQSPLNAFGEHFRILLERPALREGEMLDAVLADKPIQAVAELAESLKFVQNVDDLRVDSVIDRMSAVPGLKERFISFGNTLASGIERVRTIEQAVETTGVTVASLVAVSQGWLRIARRERNPLRLDQMAMHNLAVALLVRELAMKFKHTHEFAVAAFAHNVGRWLMAFQYPGFFGLALTLGKGQKTLYNEVELKLFGISHGELGAKFLKHHGLGPSAESTALNISDPTAAPQGTPQIVTSMVALARLLAKMRHIGFDGTTDPVDRSDFIKAKAWDALHQSKVKIPLDPPEYLSALSMIVERIRRQVEALFE